METKDNSILEEANHENRVKKQSRNRDSESIIWGVFLIFAGVVLLFNSLGILPWYIWNELISFWPVLLILGGVKMLFGSSYFSRIILTIFSIILGLFVILVALYRVNPKITNNLPKEINNILKMWEVNSR